MSTPSPVISRRGRLWAAAAVVTLLASAPWLALRADIPAVASGTWAAAGEVEPIPVGAAAVALVDGRVLVSGGMVEGVPSNGIAAIEGGAGQPVASGSLAVARSGHAAARLKDGRVLFAGGATADGPSFDVEIYDPATGESSHAGDLALARVDSAAATLADGRVLVVGGTSGDAALSLAEIFDPATGQSVPVTSPMTAARTRATATTMLDGHVLVVGGSDGSTDLGTAEIFDPASQSFFATGALQTPRSGHTAVLLPDNNQVLIAGGSSGGAAVASAELYADWRDGFLAAPSPMSVPRVGAIAAPLTDHDLAFVAGGGPTTGEYFGYATVKTDKDDYAPYETVTISGSGWQPGETVHLRVSEDADTHYDWTLEAIADASGNIVNREFYPRNDDVYKHIGMRFYLTAVGSGSQALATFTDAMQTRTTLSSSSNPSSVGQSVTFTAVVEMNDKHGNQDDWKPAVGGSVEFYDQTTAQKDDCTKNGTLLGTVNVNANGRFSFGYEFPSAGTYPIQACYKGTGGNVPGGNGTSDSFSPAPLLQQKVNSAAKTAITVTADATSKQYGAGDPAFTFTITSGALANGDSFTGALTRAAGENVGVYAISQGTLSAGSNYTITFVSANLTVTPKGVTVTAEAKSKTYGGADPTLTYTGTLNTGDSFTGALTRAAGENVGVYAISQGTLSAGSNYTITFVSADLTVTPKGVTVTAEAQSKTYGGADPTLTYTGTLNTGDSFTGALTRAAGENVGVYAISQGTLSAGSNYTITFVSANLTVTPKAVTVTAEAKSKTYGDADPALTYTGTLNTGDSFTGALARAAGENVGVYAISQGTLTAGTNYTMTFVSANLTVTAKAVTVTANAQNKTYGDADPALTYTGALNTGDSFTGALTRAAGENVGVYAITQGTLTAGDNYALTFVGANLTVTAKAVTVTANAQSKTYGDADPALTYTGALNTGDSFTGALTRAAGENVGVYAITQGTLTAGDNYALTFVGANLTVTAKAVTVTANAQSKTYGDADPALTYTGTLNTGDSFSGALARVAGENVGVYAITQGTLTAGDNYALTFAGANLTVTAKAVTVTANAQSKTYGDADPALTYTGALNTGDSFTGALTRVAGENVGSYAIGQGTLSAGSNYALTFVGANLTVTAKAVTVTANAQSKTYGDADPALTYTGALNTGDSFTGALTRAAGENVGVYAITQGTLTAGDNYALTFAGANLTVTAKAVTVTANAQSKTYGDANPALTYQVTIGSLVSGDSFSGTLTRVAGENVGSYAIGQGTLSAGSNYALTFVGANLTVTPKAVTVTANAQSKTYGDADPALTYTGALNTGDSFSGSLARAPGENVGVYAITQGTLTAGDNYALTFAGANLTVTAKAVTVTADAKSKTYGDTDPALTYQVTTGSLVSGDSFSGALARVAGENVGVYEITQGTLTAGDNYALTFAGANLTVTAKAVTVTADAKGKTYGDTDPALTYQVTTGSLVSGDSFSGNLARVAGENVGVYAITQGTLTAGDNYALTFVGANLAVTAKAVTVTADAKTKTYGDADPALTYTGTLNTGDSFTGALTRAAGENVGVYAISEGTLSAGNNYALTFVGANLTVTAKAVTVTADAKSKTYGDDNPTLTAAVTGTVNGDTLAYSLTTTAVKTSGVGSYDITVTLGTNPNYTVTKADAKLAVSPAMASIKANDKSRSYGDANPALDAVVTGTVNNDVLQYTLATAATATSGVGGYPITVTLGTNGNYAVTPTNGTLAVTKAPLAIKANDASRPYGLANPAFTGSYSGEKNGETFTMSFSTDATPASGVGTYAIVPSVAGATVGNYEYIPTRLNGTLTVGAWSLKGFYEPVGEMSSTVSAPGAAPVVSGSTVWNAIKGGQTVPMKFNIYRTAGGAQVTTVADGFAGAGFNAYQLPNCSGGYTVDEIPLTDLSTGATELRYDGTQFIQNWKTPKVTGADLCYRAVITAKDGSTLTAFFKVKK